MGRVVATKANRKELRGVPLVGVLARICLCCWSATSPELRNALSCPCHTSRSETRMQHFFTVLLYYTILYCTTTLLCFTLLYYFTLLYFILLCSALLCSALLCSALLYFTLLYFTLLYFTLLDSTLLYSTVLYCTVLYCNVMGYHPWAPCTCSCQLPHVGVHQW
jgi:hypothetical protein